MSDVNPCIPEDIWFEIFKELPVKILGKCRCVCKSWRSLVVSPSFMATHLEHYTRNDANSLLLYREMSSKIPQREQYRFFLDLGRIPLQLNHTSICPFEVHHSFKHCSFFVGSINGLLCLSDDRYLGPTSKIMLWNPFLRKMINLPTSMAATIDLDDLRSVLGFGYDSKKNDHRVVKISFCRFDDEVNPLVEVYSVWGRIWRTIHTDYLVDNSISRVYESHCFINGVIHLLASSSAGVWVLLFNVVEETFQKIELPDIFSSTCLIGVGLLEYKTKLSVSHCYNQGNTAKCQIWVKEEECWCLILNVALYNRIHIGPLDYLGRNGESFGFAWESNRKLLLCDLMTTKMKRPVKLCKRRYVTMDLPELGLRQDASTKFAAITESLVLLDQNTDVYTDEQLQRSFPNRGRPIVFNDFSTVYYGDPF